jgi:DNA uptake protein ComE-like DNA-binding protein
VRPWTSSQRVAVSVILLVVLSIGFGRWMANRAYVSDPQPDTPAKFDELADRIDPNTADVATLSALPLIGDRKARDIITYRKEQQARNPDQPAFRESRDLLKIKGIGAATVNQLERYLIFPSATTKPAD